MQETEHQKLDKLSNQMEEMKTQFRQLLLALKDGGTKLDAVSVASLSTIDGGEQSKYNTLKKNTKNPTKVNSETGDKITRKSTRRGLFESLEDALVNPTALKQKMGNLERSSTLDDDKN